MDRILIVDDDDTTRQMLSRILGPALGLEVHEARTNDEALREIQVAIPALITSDYNHSGGSGLLLVRGLRSSNETKDLPILILSGNITDQQELDLFRAGTSRVMRKPFLIDQLIAACSELLGRPEEPEVSLLHVGSETRDLDYKEKIDSTTLNGRAALAKDVIAMANSGGGNIVIGVRQLDADFVAVGLDDTEVAALEVTTINNALRRYLGGSITIMSKAFRDRGKQFVCFRIPTVRDTVVMAAMEHADAALYRGRIYHRTEDARTAEMTDAIEVQRLIDRLVRESASLRERDEELARKVHVDANAVFEVRKLGHELGKYSMRRAWDELSRAVERLNPFLSGFGLSVADEVIDACQELLVEPRRGIPVEIVRHALGVVNEVLPIHDLLGPQFRTPSPEELEVIGHALYMGFDIAYDGIRYLDDLRFVQEGTFHLSKILRFAVLNRATELTTKAEGEFGRLRSESQGIGWADATTLIDYHRATAIADQRSDILVPKQVEWLVLGFHKDATADRERARMPAKEEH